ncbi:MAG TPA: glycogen-binding domain-containing protein [Phycisphaerae bacterium]|nr:glycogen-binding domain-containing protein [Phycisphaerae bacterium]
MKVYIPHTIRVRIPHARHVAVVGDFNNWHTSAHPLVEVAPGSWERIIDLPAGKHRYAFFVLEDAAPEGSESAGVLRSRVVANGSVIWVSENPEQAVSVTAHPSLAIQADPPSIAEAA